MQKYQETGDLRLQKGGSECAKQAFQCSTGIIVLYRPNCCQAMFRLPGEVSVPITFPCSFGFSVEMGFICLFDSTGIACVQHCLSCCFSPGSASGCLSPFLLCFRASSLHLGQAPAVSTKNSLIIYSNPSSSLLTMYGSQESFYASEGKVSEGH